MMFTKVAVILLAVFMLSATASMADGGGARLHHVGANSVYAKVGLQSGDIIKAIDGQKVQSNEHATMLLYGLAGDGETHTIEVLRKGEHKEISYPE